MLEILPIGLAPVKADNTSENLIKEKRISYIFCIEKKKLLKKIYNNKMN